MKDKIKMERKHAKIVQFRYYIDKAMMEGYWEELKNYFNIPNKVEDLKSWEEHLEETGEKKDFIDYILFVLDKLKLDSSYLNSFIEALTLPNIYTFDTEPIKIKYESISGEPTIWIGIYDDTTIRDVIAFWKENIIPKRESEGKKNKLSKGKYRQSVMFRLKYEGKTDNEIADYFEKIKPNCSIDQLTVNKRISEYKGFLRKI